MIATCKESWINELTKGDEYLIVDAYGDYFVIVNDSNQRRAYHTCYFL